MNINRHDILQSKLNVPNTVYIVAPGREYDEVYTAIPFGSFIISVGDGVNCPVMTTIWLLGDPNAQTEKYFKAKMFEIKNSGHSIMPSGIHPGCSPVPVIHESMLTKHPWVRTYFRTNTEAGLQDVGDLKKSDGVLHMQASSAGAAVLLAYFLGAYEIKCIGVRLEGRYEAYRDAFDWLVRVLGKYNCKVTDLRDEIGVLPKYDDHTVRQWHPEVRYSEGVPMLLESDFQLPRELVIVGSGPEGAKVYDRIGNKPVAALNRAIDYPAIKPRWWFVADGNCAEDPKNRGWFERGCRRCEAEDIKKIWSFAVRDRAKPYKPDYLFRLVPEFEEGYRQVPGKFRPDETVAGIALDGCHRFHVKHSILCGVDMSGDKHADGTKAPGNRDDAHGEIWDSRNRLDEAIAWYQRHGMRVSTMSATQLREPLAYMDDKLPTVALLTMSFNPVYTKFNEFCAYIQNYPPHLVTHYIVTQNNEQPHHATDLPYRTIFLNADGTWTELWLLKLLECFRVCVEDYIAIFDEDDWFTPDYLINAIRALITNNKSVAWTFQNRLIDRFRIVQGYYRSPIGTIVGNREFLRDMALLTWKQAYGVDYPERTDYGHKGAQDANWRDFIIKHLEGNAMYPKPVLGDPALQAWEYGENIISHEGERWYTEHGNSNTCTGRRDEYAIDYWMPGPWWQNTPFEETRRRANE